MSTARLPFRMWSWIVISVAACGNVEAQSTSDRKIVHKVTEHADDGKHDITRDTRRVDVNSSVVVSFQALAQQTPGEPSEDWVTITNVLAQVERQMNELSAILAQTRAVDLSNTAEVNRIKAAHAAFIVRAAEYPDEWQAALGKSDSEMARITSGEAMPGRPVGRSQPYVNFAAWLRWRMESAKAATRGLVQSNLVAVTVQAFHKPFDGPLKAVHVDGYDHIPSGDSQPIDKKAVRLTPAEQRRFAADVQANERAAESIREISRNANDFAGKIKADFERLRDGLANLEPKLRRALTNWDADIGATRLGQKLLEWSTNNPAGPEAQPATVVLTEIQGFRNDLLVLQEVYSSVRFLRISAGANPGVGSLSSLLLGPEGMLGDVSRLGGKLKGLLAAMGDWTNRIGRLKPALETLAARLTPEQLTSLLPPEFPSIGEDLKSSFPKTIDLLTDLSLFWTQSGGQLSAAELLAGTDAEPIWRGGSELVDGTLDLTTVGLTEGESVLVKVKYRDVSTNAGPTRTFPDETYKLETLMMGLHRKFGASLIFARGLEGDSEEQDWKPNVAAHVHWFYRYRAEDSTWRKAWNYINPGTGIHLASLDQGDDAVEFGTGANVSLFDGLLSGGFGVNLNNDEHSYVFIGISLLDALEKAKSLKK